MSTREEILDAADALFSEVGYAAASTREIAERGGANKALIHYHFGSKDALLRAVLDRYYDRLGATLGEALVAEGSERDRLGRLLDAYVDFLAGNRGFSRIVQREAAGGAHLELIRDRLAPLFEQGRALLAGHLPEPDEAAHLLVSFYGMAATYFTYADLLAPLLDHDPLSPAQLGRRKRHLRRMLGMVLADLDLTPIENEERSR